MQDYVKEVLIDEDRVREKLNIYLQTPNKVDIYFEALDKFTYNGQISDPVFKPTWSWWAFSCTWVFFLYRKDFLMAFITFMLMFMPVFNFMIMIVSGMSGKYFVIKRFLDILKFENDAVLQDKGGVYKWVIWLSVCLNILVFAYLIWLLLFVIGPVLDQKYYGI